VLSPNTEKIMFDKSDVLVRTTKDSGPGGQHRNKTESCVVMVHTPTKIQVKVDGRDQHANKRRAWKDLEQRVRAYYQQEAKNSEDAVRANQLGSGMRGDKIRTYREKDDQVIDHRTHKRCSLKGIRHGRLENICASETRNHH